MALEQRSFIGEVSGQEIMVTFYELEDRIVEWEFEVDGETLTYQELAERFGRRIIRFFIREAGLHAR